MERFVVEVRAEVERGWATGPPWGSGIGGDESRVGCAVVRAWAGVGQGLGVHRSGLRKRGGRCFRSGWIMVERGNNKSGEECT